eukprot:comp23570_c3_seq1/m.39910 comp23570_c3_seq1/g.39910  ORF comp23570_c3_seq1/g.39910 comp23570_c3_seq1/m.39910 type:complete len:424 (-) comp23570_c3_seq1:47-1318(-)
MTHCPTDGPVGILLSLGCVLLWYTFSIGLTFYNKWLFRSYGLNFPLIITSFHMLFNFFVSWMIRVVLLRCLGTRRPVLTPEHYFKMALPTGAASALDVGLGNASLLYITISLYTICKSTSIVFLLLFAFCFKLEQPRWSLTLVIVCIAAGVLLFTYGGDVDFDLLGFLLVMCATVMSGLRWVLTQAMLQKKKLGLHNPIDTLYHVTPTMALVLLPLALAIEGIPFFSSPHMFMGTTADVLKTLTILSLGGVLAFLLNWAEFLLISRTSSVTMSVAGIFKEVCTISLSVLLFGDHMSRINAMGMCVTILGIVLYNVLKYRQVVATKKHDDGGGEYETLKEERDLEMSHVETRPSMVGIGGRGSKENISSSQSMSGDQTTTRAISAVGSATSVSDSVNGTTATTLTREDSLLRHRSHSLPQEGWK